MNSYQFTRVLKAVLLPLWLVFSLLFHCIIRKEFAKKDSTARYVRSACANPT